MSERLTKNNGLYENGRSKQYSYKRYNEESFYSDFSDAIEKLGKIEDVLYDADGNEVISLTRLRELASAERDGRIRIGSDWTPCAEGLPEDDKVVLVTASHLPLYEGDSEYPDTVFEAYHIRGTWRNTIDLQMANTKILAWQPLPAPYRADDTTGKAKEDAE